MEAQWQGRSCLDFPLLPGIRGTPSPPYRPPLPHYCVHVLMRGPFLTANEADSLRGQPCVTDGDNCARLGGTPARFARQGPVQVPSRAKRAVVPPKYRNLA